MTASPVPAADAVLTPQEVADFLKVRPRQLRRLGVPALRFGARTTRYRAADVVKWLDQFQQQRKQ